ncbi:MAG: TonB-dependent receptor [Bacteroidota bacterium]
MKQHILFSILIIYSLSLFAQTEGDHTFQLEEVDIEAVSIRQEQLIGEEWRFDSLDLARASHQSLADLLQRETNAYIKSYGLGSLASISMRGAGANHTAIIWNGLPIENPMLGQTDLALLPLVSIDQLRVHPGGNSAAWGSGAVGGSLSLDNIPSLHEGLSVTSSHLLGSFGKQAHATEFSYGKETWSSETSWYQLSADNDFTYQLLNGKERQNTNGDIRNWGLLQEIYFSPSVNHQLSATVWFQDTDRNIPPTTTQNESLAFQADRALRATLNWKTHVKRNLLSLQTGFSEESISFQDKAIRLVSDSKVQRWVQEINLSRQVREQWTYEFGYQYQYVRAEADGYQNMHDRHQHAVFANGRYQDETWIIDIGARQEVADELFYPLCPRVAASYSFLSGLRAFGAVSRNVRIPTLNELYWSPGGNPELKAEKSWNQEVGLAWEKQTATTSLSYQLTYYQRQTRDWVLWALQESLPFWSAVNLSEVHTRGLSQQLNWGLSGNTWKIDASGGYEWVQSVHTSSLQSPRIEENTQLFYVPQHKAHLSLRLSWQAWQFQYTHTYTSGVETFSTPLPSWQVGQLFLSYRWRMLEGILRIDNVWDSSYRIIERRPMPGRAIETGININLKSLNMSNL